MPLKVELPSSADAALELLSQPGSRPVAGGTDLVPAMEVGLDSARSVVDLTRAESFTTITEHADGATHIGAAVRLEAVAAHPVVAARFAALSQAAAQVGTPALRAMGTVGGNLCQRPRCWYLRSRLPCLKNGGSGCPAADGESQYHAILGGGPCHAAHPSDLAVALLALDAVLRVRSHAGARRVTVAELYVNAATDPQGETTLRPGEIIEAVELPAASAGGRQYFTKLMQRGAWDFATVSLAAARRTDGSVRLVLGGVAPAPWRVGGSVEEDVASGALDEESADALAMRALHDARPLAKNAYKVAQAAALLRRATYDLSRA